MAQLVYTTPESLAGKSLRQIHDDPSMINRFDAPDQLGVGFDSPLTKGQQFSYTTDDPTYQGGSMFQSLNRVFGQAMSPEQAAVQPAIKSLQESAPEISQKFATEKQRLEGEKDPLKNRYDALIGELKGKQTATENSAVKRTAGEFGKRGIPLTSSLYGNEEAAVLDPIRSQYGGLQKDAYLGMEDSMRNITNLISGLVPQEVEAQRGITNAIAQLQSGAGKDAIANAFQQLQFQEGQRQFNQQQSLAQNRLDFEKTQTKADEQSLRDQFMTLPEGNTLFNLLTGKAQYTAPKTYKPDSSSGDGDWG
jgi:hypothetical protein